VEDSDDDEEPGYVSCNLSREGEVIMEPDSGDKNGDCEDEEDEDSELSRSKRN
jgi:hypothetical protein